MSAALTLGGKKPGKQWSAWHPAHDDKSPSLIIFEGRTGAVQVRCIAGCEPIEIIAEIRWHEVADRLSMTPPPGERPLDGTATGRVTTKEPPPSGKKVPAVLACIAEWFPQAFVPEKYLPHRPLKIGIHIDLKTRCPALSERERSAVLRYYVARLMYLRACVAGAPRIDLDGKVCGEVTAAEAQHADARLAAILAARARKQALINSRAAARPAVPRKKEKPPEGKPPASPQRDGLAALREAAAKRRTIA
jgi:sRNA-binding protein